MKKVPHLILLALLLLVTPLLARGETSARPVRPVAPTGAIGSIVALPGVQLAPRTSADAARPHWPQAADGSVRAIVELVGAPVVAHLRQLRGDRLLPADLATPHAAAYTAELDARRASAVAALRVVAPQATVDYHYTTLFNGFAVTLPADALPTLQTLAGVQNVYPDSVYQLQLEASLPLIGAPTYWNSPTPQTDAGAGMMIAVIDSGIDPDNPFFDNSLLPVPNGYPKGYCVEVDFGFCNNKLLVARWYGINNGVPPGAQNELPTPHDRSGHGTHVAGIAAGNHNHSVSFGAAAPVALSGVAPAAQLLIYKACWRGAGCPGAGLLKAFEDAVRDGAHVINNSWGGAPGGLPTDSVFRAAIENTVALGIPVVFAAGNDGEMGAGSVHCPACVAETIAVANSLTGRLYGNRIAVADGSAPAALRNLPALWATGTPQLFPASGIAVTTAAQLNPANPLGCAAWPAASLTGRILLVSRGNCSDSDKAQHAINAGAFGVILVANQPGPIARFGIGSATQIPVLLLSQNDGAALVEWVTAFAQTRLNIGAIESLTVNGRADVLATTSSQGPNGDPNVLKPDLAAPGSEIFSAWSAAAGGNFALNSGTSMAAPHVSGALALLRQRHPEWTPAELRSALTTTAAPGVRQPDGSTAATPFGSGSGRLDLAALSRVALTFDRSAFADAACTTCTFEAQITNVSAQSATWRALVEAGGLSVVVDPASVTLPPGGTATFHIRVDSRAAAPERWHFGGVRWTDGQSATSDAWLPLAIYAVPAETSAFVKRVTATPPVYGGDTLTYALHLYNPDSQARSFSVVDTLPPTLAYIAGSATGGLTYDAETRRLSATTPVLPPALSVSEVDLGGYINLPALPPVTCTGVCDNDWFAFGGLDFSFMGQPVSDLFVSTNGFVALQEPTGNTFTPQRLPDSAAPNGVIAPLWTDLDLLGDDGDTVGGGKLYAGLVKGAADWYVFEWRNAAHWGNQFNPGVPVRHTFQLWIQVGTPFIWFTYGEQSNFGIYPAAIGAENGAGDLGATRYFNGSGSPLSSAFDLRVNNDGGVRFGYQAQVVSGAYTPEIINRAHAQSGALFLSAGTRTRLGTDVWIPVARRE